MIFFSNLSVAYQALIACLFTWLGTTLGSLLVVFFKKVNKNFLDIMLGLAAGVMIAASFFSLLNPASELASSLGMTAWIVLCVGFTLGGLFLYLGDRLFAKFDFAQGSFKRSVMLISSITLHNIPEGLAVGVAFGSIVYGIDGATTASALMLAVGIALQNFPEGAAVSLPLRREGYSRWKSFLIGCLTGIVEPISAVVGALLATEIRVVLPILLAFAAGTMIYVVCEEIIPESQTNKSKDLIALFTIIGFTVMMCLDVALG